MKVRMYTRTPLGRKGHGNAASHSGDLKKCFPQPPGCTLRLSNGPIHSFILVCLFVCLFTTYVICGSAIFGDAHWKF